MGRKGTEGKIQTWSLWRYQRHNLFPPLFKLEQLLDVPLEAASQSCLAQRGEEAALRGQVQAQHPQSISSTLRFQTCNIQDQCIIDSRQMSRGWMLTLRAAPHPQYSLFLAQTDQN